MNKANEMHDQVLKVRRRLRTDGYAMSIGEISSLYDDGDLIINPNFQRYFRWDTKQKSDFIESILLNIPTPSIFLYALDDGRWELVDGLQRVSTVLEFMGKLKGLDGDIMSPLILEETKYLPSLSGAVWSKGLFNWAQEECAKHDEFGPELKREFKRAKFDLKILTSGTDPEAKYDLFSRLNTGGTILEPQEVLNAELIRTASGFYEYLNKMSQYDAFRKSIAISDDQIKKQYDKNLVLRFISFAELDESRLAEMKYLDDFLAKRALELAAQSEEVLAHLKKLFESTFQIVAAAYENESEYKTKGARCFRGMSKNRKLTNFFISQFEIVSFGISYNIKEWEQVLKLDPRSLAGCIEAAVKNLNESGSSLKSKSGVSSKYRIKEALPLARKYLVP